MGPFARKFITRVMTSRSSSPAQHLFNKTCYWCCLWLTCLASAVWSAELDDEDVPPPPPELTEAAPQDRRPNATRAARQGVTEDGPGIIGNVGFLGMGTFGRDDSIAPVEVLPYLLLDEDLFFSNLRGFISTEGYFGGNFGVGYRRLVPNQHAWYGINAWYDIDDTSSQMYHQLGFGVEAAFKSFEVRSNAYFPVGSTDKILRQSAANARFEGQQLVYDQLILRGQALRGVDAEVGYVLPIPALGEDSVLRWYVGGYFFSGSGDADGITGVQTRAEAQIATTVTTHVQFSNDKEYGSNLMVGVSLELPFGEAHPTAKWKRNTPSPFRFVHRNYNIILDRRDASLQGVPAINPQTGEAYIVGHVDTNAGAGGLGGVNDPFQSLAAAKAAGADLIFVRSGSIIDEAFELDENTWLAGDFGRQFVELPNSRSILLPTFNEGGPAPRFTGITGDAITLASGSRVSGFQIDNITGNGVVGDGITHATLQNLSLSDISGDAFRFNDVGGTIRLQNITADDVQGTGFLVMGGNANFDVRTASLTNIGDDGIRLQDIAGGQIDLADVTLEDVGQHGLALHNVNANVNVRRLEMTNTGGTAIDITGGTGTFVFSEGADLEDVNGGVRIVDTDADITFRLLDVLSNGVDPAVLIENTTGELHLDKVNVTTTTGEGIVLRNVDDLTIDAGVVSTGGHTAFDAEDSHFEVKLSQVFVDGAPVGIRLVDVTGGFAVVGLNRNGGKIENTDVGVQLDNAGTVILTYLDFNDNGIAIQSRDSDLIAIANSKIQGTDTFGIDSYNDTLVSVQNSLFKGNAAVDGSTIRLLVDKAGSFRSEFLSNTIEDTNGTPLLITNAAAATEASLETFISGNVFKASRGDLSAVNIAWNGTVGATVSNNDFVLTGANMRAINIETTSTSRTLTANVNGNDITLEGAGSTGINIKSAGASNMQFQQNLIEMKGSGGTGLRFELSGATTTWLAANNIRDTGSAGTGVHFVNLVNNSKVQIDGNVIQMLSTSSAVDRGILFSTISGTVQLYGQTTNIITGATEDVSLPAGSTTGGFLVNGVKVP